MDEHIEEKYDEYWGDLGIVDKLRCMYARHTGILQKIKEMIAHFFAITGVYLLLRVSIWNFFVYELHPVYSVLDVMLLLFGFYLLWYYLTYCSQKVKKDNGMEEKNEEQCSN